MFEPENVDHQAFRYYPRLGEVKRYLDLRYREPLNLQALAEVAGLERTYLSRLFHEKTAVCFRDWLSWTRVSHAMVLMASDDRSITEVALEVGFHDLRTFERAVERCTGHTPRSMRNRLHSSVDMDYRVQLIDPAVGDYVILVHDEATRRITPDQIGVPGPYSNPRIEPFGPPKS